MYTISLEINQRCNLRCRYCYLGEKNEKRMTLDVGCKALDIAFVETKRHKDKKLWINFIGGEPLLDFELIQELVHYAESQNKILNYKLMFSITTNATIVNPEIIEFLCEKDFMLKISLDGIKIINDLNRVSLSGTSVHDKVLSNLPFLKEYQNRGKHFIQVTNVVTGNNYESYFESLKYLTSDLGLKIVDTAIDVSYNWNAKEVKIIEDNVRKAFDYYIEKLFKGEGFWWSLILSLINMEKKHSRFYVCGAGIVSMYVRADGSIMPCPGNLDSSMSIGTVETGVVKEKVDFYKNFESISNEKCNECDIYDHCVEKACVAQNLAICKDVNIPIPIMCERRKFLYKLYKENERLLNEVRAKIYG